MKIIFLGTGTSTGVPEIGCQCEVCTSQDKRDWRLRTSAVIETEGKRILIVDDVVSTGESLHAMEQLVSRTGGTVCGRMAILAEGDAQNRPDLIYLEKLPLFDADGKPID